MKIIKFMVLFLFFVVSFASAQEVRVIGNESMPWNGIVNGTPQGIFIDVMEEASRHGAPPFKYEIGLPWIRAQHMVLEAGDALTVIIPLSRIPSREDQYMWISNVVIDDIRLISLKSTGPIQSVSEAKKKIIGVVNGHVIIPVLQEKGITDYVMATTIEQLVMMLKYGRIDAICEGALCMSYNWKIKGYDVSELDEGIIMKAGSLAYIGANLQFPKETALQISMAIDSMRLDGSYQAIIDKWTR